MEIKIEDIKTTSDMLDVYKRVKAEYPELTVYIPHPIWGTPFEQYFGIETTKMKLDDGSISHYSVTPQYKEYLLFMNELVREGYMSVESFAYQPEQFFQIVRSGEIFSASYNTGLADDSNRNYYDKNNIDAHLVAMLHALTIDGDMRYRIADVGVGWASLFITKNCQNPDRAIQYMEFLKSPEGDRLTQWGIEDLHYTLEKGIPIATEHLLTASDKGIKTGVGPWYFQASGLCEGLRTYANKLNQPDYSQNVDLLLFTKANMYRDPARYFTIPQPDSNELVIETKVNEYIKTQRIQVMSAASVAEAEAAYEEMMSNLRTIGIEALNTFYNEQYTIAQEKYKDLK